MLSLFLMAFSLSIDALGVGIAYGLKKIRIPLSSGILMSFMSFCCALIAVGAGKLLYTVLPPKAGGWLSVLILVSMGIYMIDTARKLRKNPEDQSIGQPSPTVQKQMVLEFLGLTITIIQNPPKGDFDGSKAIERNEAVYLGLALSLDSLGAGIGYSMGASSVFLLPFCICLFQFLFLTLGTGLGKHISRLHIHETFFSLLPGIIMLLLAALRIFGSF